jgi:hypothetical protein
MKKYTNLSVGGDDLGKTVMQETIMEEEEFWDCRMWNPVLFSIYYKAFNITRLLI